MEMSSLVGSETLFELAVVAIWRFGTLSVSRESAFSLDSNRLALCQKDSRSRSYSHFHHASIKGSRMLLVMSCI
jgi:hypothetical protein